MEEKIMTRTNAETEKKTEARIPNKAYDLEYGTQYRKQVEYLSACGFKYTFVKKNEYGVKTYKYAKTPELFRAIALFYDAQRNEKQFNYFKSMSSLNMNDSFMKSIMNAISAENNKVVVENE